MYFCKVCAHFPRKSCYYTKRKTPNTLYIVFTNPIVKIPSPKKAVLYHKLSFLLCIHIENAFYMQKKWMANCHPFFISPIFSKKDIRGKPFTSLSRLYHFNIRYGLGQLALITKLYHCVCYNLTNKALSETTSSTLFH